jgi:hypothetical protein
MSWDLDLGGSFGGSRILTVEIPTLQYPRARPQGPREQTPIPYLSSTAGSFDGSFTVQFVRPRRHGDGIINRNEICLQTSRP